MDKIRRPTNSCCVYLRSLRNARRSDMAICLCYWTFFFTHKVDFCSWVTPSNWTCWWRTLQWYQYQYKQCINIHTIKYCYRWSEVVFKVAVCFKTLYPGSTIGFSTPFKPTPPSSPQSHNPDGYLGITHPVHAVIPKSSPPQPRSLGKSSPSPPVQSRTLTFEIRQILNLLWTL